MKRKRAATRVWVWTLVLFILIGVLMLGLNGFSFASLNITGFGTAFRYDDSGEYTPGSASVSTQSIRQIDIHWVAGEVRFIAYDGDTIQFSETAGRALDTDEQLHYRVKNDKLTLQYRASGRLAQLFSNTPAKTLEVLVPASMALDALKIENVSSIIAIEGGGMAIPSVDIETVSGSVSLAGLTGRSLDVESVSGAVKVAGDFDAVDLENVSGSITVAAQGNTLELSSTSGSMDVQGAFQEISAEIVSGNQTYRLTRTPTAMRAESVSGGITLYLTKAYGFNASLDSLSGSLRSDFAMQSDKHHASFGDGKASLRFETVSGGVSLLYDASLEAAATPTPSPKPSATPDPGNSFSTDPIPASQRKF